MRIGLVKRKRLLLHWQGPSVMLSEAKHLWFISVGDGSQMIRD